MLAEGEATSFEQLERVIAEDPGLALKLVKLANSAFYGGRHRGRLDPPGADGARLGRRPPLGDAARARRRQRPPEPPARARPAARAPVRAGRRPHAGAEADRAFTVGLFSVVDSLLGMRMPAAARRAAVRRAHHARARRARGPRGPPARRRAGLRARRLRGLRRSPASAWSTSPAPTARRSTGPTARWSRSAPRGIGSRSREPLQCSSDFRPIRNAPIAATAIPRSAEESLRSPARRPRRSRTGPAGRRRSTPRR